MIQKDEYYDGGDQDIDIDQLNALEKENFDKNFESIISFVVKEEKPKSKQPFENLSLSSSTSASIEENPITKFNSLKTKIDELEKDLKVYSESQNLIQHNETLDEYFERLKKLKETSNFIANSKNYSELKKILDSNKNNKEKNIDKYKILQMKMIENLNMHLINRANIINQLKSENPEEYNNLDYELYITPESKKIKKITKILEIKNKLNKIKERLGNIEVQNDKENLLSIVKDLKEKIKIQDIDFKKKIEEQKNLINKRVKEMDINTDFYDILDKEYLDALFFGFKSSEEIENIINETVTKMESLKDRHEISAFVGLKLQEMIEQQVKLGNEIVDNSEILINLKKNIKNNVEVMKKNLELLKIKLGVK
jgi:hypothetical protein